MKNTMYKVVLMATMASLLGINTPVFASETDNRIESSAKQSYVFKTYLKGADIQIQSKAGDVTLTGTVSEEAYIELARETVASLPGVNRVINNLKVDNKVPAVYTDAWLITKVKSTLLFHRNVNAMETDVFAKDKTVTLRGKATSAAQMDLATEYAKDVEGVENVKNEMTVVGAAPAAGEDTMGENIDAMMDLIDDASITAMVKTMLMWHRSTSALNTTVLTTAGVVLLGGQAKNAAEQDLATKLVSDVHGVKKVVNNMTVE